MKAKVRGIVPLLALSIVSFAESSHAQVRVVPDQVFVRYITPETGGAARPRFFTEREVAFFARVEAAIERIPIENDSYPERHVRVATERLVARAMLSSLLVQGGSEPPDLATRVIAARAELAGRMGGGPALDGALRREGIEENELAAFLRDEVRAIWYVDKALQPLLNVGEDSLREAYRSTVHPFRSMKYDDVKRELRLWLIVERMRSFELEYLQSARSRIRITAMLGSGL